jgi:ribosomal-protein-alanine N-acetyltransferase
MQIATPRFLLRDLEDADRAAFIAYQADPRYRRLYDLGEDHAGHAAGVFARFQAWQAEMPRRNVQLGICDRDGRLIGCAGLRRDSHVSREAVLGIELTPDDWGRYRLAIEVAAALIGFGFRDRRARAHPRQHRQREPPRRAAGPLVRRRDRRPARGARLDGRPRLDRGGLGAVARAMGASRTWRGPQSSVKAGRTPSISSAWRVKT